MRNEQFLERSFSYTNIQIDVKIFHILLYLEWNVCKTNINLLKLITNRCGMHYVLVCAEKYLGAGGEQVDEVE